MHRDADKDETAEAEEAQRTGSAWAPLYDAARALLSREGRWRNAIISHIAPRPHDLIVAMPCGGGELVLELARRQPFARIMAIDPDPAEIARAQARVQTPAPRLEFACARLDDVAAMLGPATATKVIVSLTDARDIDVMRKRLDLARAIIDPLGAVFVIAYGPQRSALMRSLNNAARALGEAPSPPATDALTVLLRSAGFVAVDEAAHWPTPAGSLSLYRARAS